VNVNATEARAAMPLHITAQHRHVKLVKLLVDRGADVDATDCNGETLAFTAIFNDHADM